MGRREKGPTHKHNELRKVIAKRLREGQPFVLGAPKQYIDYWISILSLHFPSAKLTKVEDGLRIERQ